MNFHDPHFESRLMMTRRQLFGRSALGVGTAAMANLFGNDLLASAGPSGPGTHHSAKAKRVIYLMMGGGP
ncbi:MAG: sulfatase, partial [Pseudomonadota bacterium]